MSDDIYLWEAQRLNSLLLKQIEMISLLCVQVLVKAGDKVSVGDPLMVMIAMKMEVRESCWLRLTHTFSPLTSSLSLT